MKKTKFLCFLGLLCLFGSMISCKQEVAESSPTGGTGTESQAPAEHTEPAPVVIYGEIRSQNPVDSVEIRFWENFLHERARIPPPLTKKLATNPGQLFDGSIGTVTFLWEGPALSAPGRLSIRNGRHRYLDRYHLMPGDSVRILMDLDRGRILFAGPSAQKFQCQYELGIAMESETYSSDPVMYTPSMDNILISKRDSSLLSEAETNHSPIRRKMRFIFPGQPAMDYKKEILSEEQSSHPGWKVLDKYRESLPGDFVQVMEADLLGNILAKRISTFNRGFEKSPGYLAFYKSKVAPMPEDHFNGDIIARSIGYADYLFEKNTLKSVAEGIPVTELYGDYPDAVHDLLYGRYLAVYYRRFSDSNSRFEKALKAIATPWIKEAVQDLYDAQKTGSALVTYPLFDNEGKEVDLAEFRGKTLFLDFWFTGCQACVLYYRDYLSLVEEHFRDDPGFMVVSVSADREAGRWEEGLSSGKYTSGYALNLNTGGMDHPFLRYYNIRAFPAQMLVNARGEVVQVGNFPKDSRELVKHLEAISTTQ